MSQENNGIWVVVHVWRGFASDIRLFRREDLSRAQERMWQKSSNPQYDDTRIFCACIESEVS
jgi:hypothetical protein